MSYYLLYFRKQRHGIYKLTEYLQWEAIPCICDTKKEIIWCPLLIWYFVNLVHIMQWFEIGSVHVAVKPLILTASLRHRSLESNLAFILLQHSYFANSFMAALLQVLWKEILLGSPVQLLLWRFLLNYCGRK